MFTVTGRLDDGREGSVSWYPLGRERVHAAPKKRRGLVGDEGLTPRAISAGATAPHLAHHPAHHDRTDLDGEKPQGRHVTTSSLARKSWRRPHRPRRPSVRRTLDRAVVTRDEELIGAVPEERGGLTADRSAALDATATVRAQEDVSAPVDAEEPLRSRPG